MNVKYSPGSEMQVRNISQHWNEQLDIQLDQIFDHELNVLIITYCHLYKYIKLSSKDNI